MSEIQKIMEATVAGDQRQVAALTAAALAGALKAEEIIEKGLIPAMETVGQRFSAGEIYIPEMLLAARAMKAGLECVKPQLAGQEMETFATVVLGTVAGDMHDIGKNLVAMMLEGSGIKVVDLGVDVSPQRFVEAAATHRPDVVALSALLTTTMGAMAQTIRQLKAAGLAGVKVVVGGAPVTQAFADEIGADGYGVNAAEAVNLVKRLLP